MSSETADNYESLDGSSKVKTPAKSALTSSSHRSSGSWTGFDLGLGISGSLKNEDIQRIISIQEKSLKNFSRTNELLGKFNDFSSSKYDALQHMFLQHTRLLVDLKKDLTNVFLRIRRLKEILQKQYPEAFDATFNLRQDLEDRLEQEEAVGPTYVSNTTDEHESKQETKNGNLKLDEFVTDINDDSSLGPKHEKKSSETDNSGLHSDSAKIDNDSSSQSRNETSNSCIVDKKEFFENLENCVKSDKESEGAPEDKTFCGNNDNGRNEILRNENTQEGFCSLERKEKKVSRWATGDSGE